MSKCWCPYVVTYSQTKLYLSSLLSWTCFITSFKAIKKKKNILARERQGVVDVNRLFLAADSGQIRPLFVYLGADWLQQLLWDSERATSGWVERVLIRSRLRFVSESVSEAWTAALIRSLPESLKMNELTNISCLTYFICSEGSN